MGVKFEDKLLARRERLDPHRRTSANAFKTILLLRQMWRSKSRFLSIASSTFFGVADATIALTVQSTASNYANMLIFSAIACLVVGVVTIRQSIQVAAMEAREDYSLMLATGFNEDTLFHIVTIQSALASLFGSFGGWIAGWVIAYYGSPFIARAGISGLDGLSANMNIWITLIVISGGVLSAVVAAWEPAEAATKADYNESMQIDHKVSKTRILLGVACFILGVGIMLFNGFTGAKPDIVTVVAECSLFVIGVYVAFPFWFQLIARFAFWLPMRIGKIRKNPVWVIAQRSITRRRTAATSVAAAFSVGLIFLGVITVVGSYQSVNDQFITASGYGGMSRIYLTNKQEYFTQKDLDAWARIPGVKNVLLYSAYEVKDINTKGAEDKMAFYQVNGNPFDGLIKGDVTNEKKVWKEGNAVVGYKTAERFGYKVGQKITIKDPLNNDKPKEITIAYITHNGMSFDSVLTPANVKPKDGNRAYIVFTKTAAAKTDSRAFNDKMRAEYPNYIWNDTETVIRLTGTSALRGLLVYYAAGTLIITVSVFGLFTMMALAVMQRKRELGLLAAVGMKDRDMKKMLRLEALILSFAAGVIGVGSGTAMGYVVGTYIGMTTLDSSTVILEFWLIIATMICGWGAAYIPSVVAVTAGATTIRDE